MFRSLKNSLFVARQYLCFHWLKSILLVTALSIILFVPFFLNIVVKETQKQLTARSQITPLLLGAKGSSLDLAVNSLYFLGKQPQEFDIHEARMINETDLANTIPFYNRFTIKDNPIIGTTSDYFSFRNLQVSGGELTIDLGDAVIGASFAQKDGLKVGDSIISSPENLFDLAGVYPLKMTVAGILKPTGTADDQAIFVDIKTSWIIAGLGHGHDDLAHADQSTAVSSSTRMYNVITKDNINAFHFHGHDDKFPITAAIIIPNDHKSKTLLLGQYQSDEELQLIQPKHIINELVESIFNVKKVLDVIVRIIIFSTVLTIFLVYILSIKLRENEIATIFRLGCSRLAISGFIASEIIILSFLSCILSGLFLLITQQYSSIMIVKLFIT